MSDNENCNCEQAIALQAFVGRAALLLDEGRDLLDDRLTNSPGIEADWCVRAGAWIEATNTSPFCEEPEPEVVTLAREVLSLTSPDVALDPFARRSIELAEAVLREHEI